MRWKRVSLADTAPSSTNGARRCLMYQLRFAILIMVLATIAVLDGTGQERSRAHPDPYLNYIAWNGTKWSAKPEGKGFIIAEGGDWKKGFSDTHISYTAWNGSKWDAKPEGKGFI